MSESSDSDSDSVHTSQEHDVKIEKIVDNLAEDQIATLKDVEARLQAGLKDIDAGFLDYVQKLPTITVAATQLDEKWRGLNKRGLVKFIESNNMLKDDEDLPDTIEELIALISSASTTSKPVTLNPLFVAQRNFKENIKKLNAIVCKLLLVMKEIPEPAQTIALRNAIEQAEIIQKYTSEEKFYIMVFGELKAGKSTTLNVLLEDDILPAASLACTVVITELHYGETRKLKTVDKAGNIHEQNLDLSGSNASKILSEFLETQNPDRNNPVFSKIILELPSPILKAGIVFVDTPGLSENKSLEALVDEYMEQAVGVLCILNSSSDGGKVKMNLQSRVERLDKIDGMEVAFVCNKIDQVDEPELILNKFREDVQVYLPNRYRKEFVIPFDAREALRSKKQGLQTPAQTAFVTSMVYYLEISFRSRMRSLFESVLSYTKVKNPIIQCVKFDMHSMMNTFSLSHKNREKIAQMLKEMVEKKENILKNLEESTNKSIQKSISDSIQKYTAKFLPTHQSILDFAAAQIDIVDSNPDRHNMLLARLLDYFAVRVNSMKDIKEVCLKDILDALNNYANNVKATLDDLQQFCLRKWTTKLLEIWEQAGEQAKENILSACLHDAVDHVSIELSTPIPVTIATLQMPGAAALRVWNLLNNDLWRRDTAQGWINNELYKKQIPGILFVIQKQAETIMKDLAKVVEERLSHVREFIANINRKSVAKTMELCQALLNYTVKIEEEAAEFSFDTVKQHLTNITITSKFEGRNEWQGKWGDKDIALKKLTGTDATYYSRFLELEHEYFELCHPNVAEYYGTVILPDVASQNSSTPTRSRYLVTEAFPHTLQHRINDLDPHVAVDIITGIALGAEHINSKKLMHINFHSTNIMLTSDLTPKIADQNLCTSSLLSKDHCKAKQMGKIAPELHHGKNCTPEVDIFAFGKCIDAVYNKLAMPQHLLELSEACCDERIHARPTWAIIKRAIKEEKMPRDKIDDAIGDIVFGLFLNFLCQEIDNIIELLQKKLLTIESAKDKDTDKDEEQAEKNQASLTDSSNELESKNLDLVYQ